VSILVRPVREQVEHDRVIRTLVGKWRRKFDVAANVGEERNAAIKVGTSQLYPDLVVTSQGKLHAIVEVETGESVNHLEALAQWAPFSKARTGFHLYVPAAAVDSARRLCADYHATPSELWSFMALGDEIRFTQVYRAPAPRAPRPAETTRASRPAAKAAKKATRPQARSASARTSTAKRPVRAISRGRQPASRPSRARSARASRTLRTQKRR
jgi:hypothetical protein